jgi:Porphyromonas-type peptidyl-arginine deiminase
MTTATDRLRGHHDQDRHDQDHTIPVSRSVVVPHESHAHACTWMSYGASTKIWGRQRLVEAVKANLRTIAIAIAQQQEVVRVLVRPDEYQQAMKEFESDLQQQKQPILQQNIILIPIPSNINDIWIRDIFLFIESPTILNTLQQSRVHRYSVRSTETSMVGVTSNNMNVISMWPLSLYSTSLTVSDRILVERPLPCHHQFALPPFSSLKTAKCVWKAVV